MAKMVHTHSQRRNLKQRPGSRLRCSSTPEQRLRATLRIHDPKTDKRIDFVGGIRGLGELERRCSEDCALAFSMYATSIGELLQ